MGVKIRDTQLLELAWGANYCEGRYGNRYKKVN